MTLSKSSRVFHCLVVLIKRKHPQNYDFQTDEFSWIAISVKQILAALADVTKRKTNINQWVWEVVGDWKIYLNFNITSRKMYKKTD